MSEAINFCEQGERLSLGLEMRTLSLLICGGAFLAGILSIGLFVPSSIMSAVHSSDGLLPSSSMQTNKTIYVFNALLSNPTNRPLSP